MPLFDKGSVMLKTQYLPREYQLEMTVVQACICMALNDKERVTMKELCDNHGLTMDELRRALKTAFCKPKVGVVQNSSGKPKFEDPSEEIFINMKFTSKTIMKSLVPKKSPEQLIKEGFSEQVKKAVDPARN